MPNVVKRLPVLIVDPEFNTVRKKTISSDVNREIKDYLGFTHQPLDDLDERREYFPYELSDNLCFLSEFGDLNSCGGGIPLVSYWRFNSTGQEFTSCGIIIRMVDNEYCGLTIGTEMENIISSISFHEAEEHELFDDYRRRMNLEF